MSTPRLSDADFLSQLAELIDTDEYGEQIVIRDWAGSHECGVLKARLLEIAAKQKAAREHGKV